VKHYNTYALGSGSEFALSDFRLFGLLKDALRGHCFASGHELKETVHMWLADQSKTLLYDGIHKPAMLDEVE
jgi:hypothetical protein